MNKRLVCCVCNRQIVSYNVSEKNIIGGYPYTLMGFGNVCCHECATGLDENGMFPDEIKEINK